MVPAPAHSWSCNKTGTAVLAAVRCDLLHSNNVMHDTIAALRQDQLQGINDEGWLDGVGQFLLLVNFKHCFSYKNITVMKSFLLANR